MIAHLHPFASEGNLSVSFQHRGIDHPLWCKFYKTIHRTLTVSHELQAVTTYCSRHIRSYILLFQPRAASSLLNHISREVKAPSYRNSALFGIIPSYITLRSCDEYVETGQQCMPQRMKVKLEFGGGLELLFGNEKEQVVDIPAGAKSQLTVSDVMIWARDNLLTERPELFVKGNSVRPGILVLVNDVDWELSGQLETEVEENDTVIFISTLHGG